MAFIKLHKTVETIYFSDDKDAPKFEIHFDDENLEKMRVAISDMQTGIKALADSGKEDAEKTAALFEQFIVAVAGDECYKYVLDFVDVNKQGAAHCNQMLGTVVAQLSELIVEHMDSARSRRLAHYINDGKV